MPSWGAKSADRTSLIADATIWAETKNETGQYEVIYSQKTATSSHCVGSGVGCKEVVGRTVGDRVGTNEGLRVLAIAEIEVSSTVSSRLWSASETAAVKPYVDNASETADPSSAEDARSPSPVLESGAVTSKVTSQVTESRFRRRAFSLVFTLKFFMADEDTPI